MSVKADDPDEDANIKYSLLKSVQGSDRRGFPLKDDLDSYDQLFRYAKFHVHFSRSVYQL